MKKFLDDHTRTNSEYARDAASQEFEKRERERALERLRKIDDSIYLREGENYSWIKYIFGALTKTPSDKSLICLHCTFEFAKSLISCVPNEGPISFEDEYSVEDKRRFQQIIESATYKLAHDDRSSDTNSSVMMIPLETFKISELKAATNNAKGNILIFQVDRTTPGEKPNINQLTLDNYLITLKSTGCSLIPEEFFDQPDRFHYVLEYVVAHFCNTQILSFARRQALDRHAVRIKDLQNYLNWMTGVRTGAELDQSFEILPSEDDSNIPFEKIDALLAIKAAVDSLQNFAKLSNSNEETQNVALNSQIGILGNFSPILPELIRRATNHFETKKYITKKRVEFATEKIGIE